MKKIIGLIFCVLLMAACSQVNNGDIAYRITEKDLIPEGITYSSTTDAFYISSIYKTKIVQVDAKTGAFKDFIPSDLVDMRFLGMITDESRGHLWACGNMTKNGETFSTVSKFNLQTGELLKSYSYPDTIANTYNDLVLDNVGNVYFTDSDGQCVYKIGKQSDSISVFFDGKEIAYPNGITISPDYKYLYIASFNNGIRILDIEKREIIGEPLTLINSTGLDGVKYYEHSIIGIQNAVRFRSDRKIVQYFLDESETKIVDMKIIDQNNPHFDIPTTFVIADDYLYCLANSQLGNISTEDEIRSVEALDDVLVLKYKLK